MLLKEIRRLPTRVLAVARHQINLLIHAPVVARNVALRVAQTIAIGWRQHVSKRIQYLKFGWAAGAAYMEALDPYEVVFADTTGRQRVGSEIFKPDPRLAVILAFGQSNIGNEGDPNGLYVPGPGVYNFNILDGQCYVAQCPLLGTSLKRGNFATRLGDLLVRRKIYDRVLLVPIGHGGTYITDWAPGGWANFRLMLALELLHRRGITITHAIFQQGEAEGTQSNPDGTTWARNFNSMVNVIRRYGMEAPIYVAQCSVCRCKPNEVIQAAQRNVVDPAQGIYAGPDTDTIGLNERWDGCHFSTAGLEKAARLWFDIIAHQRSALTSRQHEDEHHNSSAPTRRVSNAAVGDPANPDLGHRA